MVGGDRKMKRQEFSNKVKLAAFERAKGHCEVPWCNAKLHPGRFIYDHRNPDYFGGEPTVENCQVICRECNRDKTNNDATDIAKSRRIVKREAGIRKKRSIRAWRKFDKTPVYANRDR